MTKENHEKTPVSLVGTGIRTRDLPNASLVRYHGATSLGYNNFVRELGEGFLISNNLLLFSPLMDIYFLFSSTEWMILSYGKS